MKLMIAGISLFTALVAVIWFFMGHTPDQNREAVFREMGVAPTVDPEQKGEDAAQAPILQSTKAIAQAITASGDIVKGKIILKATRDQVKLSQESGGIGPTGFITGYNGEVYFSDRFNDRVVEISPDGKERVIYKSDPDEYIRGHGIDRDGNSYVLVGNDEYSLMKVTPDGKAARMEFSHKPEHLNGMRVDAREDAVYLIGVDKTVKVDKTTGEKTEVYGVPGFGNEEALDVVLTEEGQGMATFRGMNGAPIKTVPMGDDKFGAVLGTFALDDGNFVVAFESDPSLNDQDAENPKITVRKINPNGETLSEVKIPKEINEESFEVDQPLNVTRDGKLQQVRADPTGTEVVEYELP